jgi:hypothetical protein
MSKALLDRLDQCIEIADWEGTRDSNTLREVRIRLADLEQCEAATKKNAIPEGWKLVPIEPTETQRLAGMTELPIASALFAYAVYKAMVNAVPQEDIDAARHTNA